MPDIWMDVDTALSEVPINLFPLIDDTDFKTREESVVYNQAGLDLVWNFVTTDGTFSQTAVTPTDTAGDYDWVNQGNAMYTIEIPASGGASINNDTEGFGWFEGYATGILPWRGPVIGFRASGINDVLIDISPILKGAAVTGTLSTTQMTTDLTEVTDDHFNGRIIIWTSGVLKNQATDITDYTGSSKMFTYTAVTEAPSNGDTFVIL